MFRAVVTGRRHASKGQYCQDFADVRVTKDFAAAALSDGAGGGNCSEYGAVMNVDTFLSCCEDNIPYGQDGMIYGRKRDGSVECISDAENFYVSNRTFFTIESDADEHLYTKMLNAGDYDRLLMMTDGVYNGYPVSEGKDERAGFIAGIFRESDREDFDETALARLIDTEQVLRYGDDHSAVLLRLH